MQLWRKFWQGAVGESKLKQYLFSSALSSLLLQIFSAFLTLASALTISRITADEGFGIYSTVFTWLTLGAMLALFGTDDLLTREIPILHEKSDKTNIQQLIKWTTTIALIGAGLVILVFLFCLHILELPIFVQYKEAYYWGLLSLPCFVLLYNYQAALRAMRYAALGQLSEKIIQPSFFILFLIGGYGIGFLFDDVHAVAFRSITLLIATIAAAYILRKQVNLLSTNTILPFPKPKKIKWLKSCLFFMLASLLYAVNTRVDIAMLDIFQVEAAQIGHYNAAARLSEILSMPFMLLGAIAAPVFAQLFKTDKAKLQQFYAQATLMAFVLTLIGFGGLWLLGEWILGLFGKEYKGGYAILLLLSCAKLLHAFVGPVSYLLMMADKEKAAMYSIIASVVFTLLAHNLWIPLYGVAGAAWATFVGLLFYEGLQILLLWRYLRLYPTVLSYFIRIKK